VGSEILGRLFALAGGKDAPLVVIPTAGGQDEYAATGSGSRCSPDFGVTNITVLHTRDRAVADSEAFVRPITTARAVWFVGGRQWRLVDAYAQRARSGRSSACWSAAAWSPGRRPARRFSPPIWSGARARTTSS